MEVDARLVRSLCERALDGETLSRDELVTLLGLGDVRNLEILRRASEEGLRRWSGEAVEIFFRLPISSHCEGKCLYCDLRSGNEQVRRFRLSASQVVEKVLALGEQFPGTVVLDGAGDKALETDYFENLLSELSGRTALPSPVLSLGERSRGYYERLKAIGVRRYVLEHKTASPILYNQLHPDADYFDRLDCMRTLLSLGFSVATSVIVGLPHQDLWDLADDFIQVAELGIDTVIIAPFIPGARSPLAASRRGSVQAALNAVAVARLALRNVNVLGGLTFNMLDSGSLVESLRWGADGIVVHVPPLEADSSSAPLCESVTTRIRSMGRRVGRAAC